MSIENTIMRMYDVFLNGNISLGEASKVALRTANSEGVVPNDDGVFDGKFRITEIFYSSKDARNTETLDYKRYIELGSPRFIGRKDDGSVAAYPEVLVPRELKAEPQL